jgi:cell division protein FtsW (lipid II flippase)
MSSDNFKSFLSQVTSRVKSKEAHHLIEKELINHLQELSLSFQQRKLSKEAAEEKAIQEMGNPYTLGEKLNLLHKPKMDWLLVGLFILIAGISFLPLINGAPDFPNANTNFIGHKVFGYLLAILIISGALFMDYRKLLKYWMIFYGTGLLLHLYTSIFGITINGSKIWISFFGVALDVTLISLFLFFLAWAGILTKINEHNKVVKQFILLLLLWTPIIIYLGVSSWFSCIIYLISILAMFTFSQVRKKLAIKLVTVNLLFGIFSTVTGLVLFTSLRFYFSERLSNGGGYWDTIIHHILSQASWFGKGTSSNDQVIPSAHTDLAFPYLISIFGWAFGIALCIILLLFIMRILMNAFKTKDLFGRLIVMGGAVLFIVPTIWSILMGLGILPIIGVYIPFISYGNTILIVYSAILGLMLSVYRRKDMVEPTVVNNRFE